MVQAILNRMGFAKMDSYKHLRLLLGYTGDDRIDVLFTEEDYNTCKQIAGPYGYAIVRMLCIKRGINDLQLNCEEQQNLPPA